MSGPPTVGIDLGSANVKLVAVAGERGGEEVLLRLSTPSRGNPLSGAWDLLAEATRHLGAGSKAAVGITGAASPRLHRLLGDGPVLVNEIVAASAAVAAACPEARTILDLGGQLSKWILVGRVEDDLLGQVEDFALNGPCAAGSGAFLEQQASRLEMSLGELGALAVEAERGATIAGRCSVFAKSDMIHLQQKGTPPEEIAYGLCLALARTFASTVLGGRRVEEPLALVGGGASNPGLVQALAEVLGVAPGDLIVPEDHLYVCAIGAAHGARGLPASGLEGLVDRRGAEGAGGARPGAHEPLRSRRASTAGCTVGGSEAPPEGALQRGSARRGGVGVHLGIDVGSVSTNAVLLVEPSLEILAEAYVPTRGRPVEALDEALSIVRSQAEEGWVLEVLSVGATGSGRHLAERLVGADLVKNEITAQLVSAARYFPDVETVFEIGGQDSKLIDARGGQLRDFEMNKICAAGTGSFLEEQAERLGVRIEEEFSDLALRGTAPVDLGSRCTVFMDAELCRAMAGDAAVEDLCAGLAYSVARNYLEKVVAGRDVGEVVVFQGGTSANEAVVAAFGRILGRPVQVHPHGRISGAIGSALLSAEEATTRPIGASRFRGFDACRDHEVRSFECGKCDNRCQVNRVKVGDRTAHFGDVCERYTSRDRAAVSSGGDGQERPFPELFGARAALLEEHLPRQRREGRPRVGLVRGSLSAQYLPLWAHLVDDLGFEPVVAPRAPRGTEWGGKGLPSEVCLPLKIAHGQVHYLLEEAGVERVLLPAVLELDTRQPRDRPATCLYAQQLPDMAKLTFGERLLTPQLGISAKEGLEREAVRALAEALGAPARRVRKAWHRARDRQAAFEGACRRLGEEALADLSGDAVLVMGKPYNLHDPDTNLGLARTLDRLGLPALPMDLLPLDEEPLAEQWYMLPWQLSRDQVRALQLASRRPGLHPLHVSSYGCGPDAFTVKHLERAWGGGRPRLFLEFDEHRGEAGLVTRLEAFADEIAAYRERRRSLHPIRQPEARDNVELPPGTRCLVPYTSAHAHAYAGVLRRAGLRARVLERPDAETLRRGEEVSSGRECHPYSIIAGDLAKLIARGDFEPGDRFFMPSTRLPCLLGQYGDGFRRILEEAGEGGLGVFDQHPGEAAELLGPRAIVALYEGLTVIDYLVVLGCSLRPRELTPGAVDGVVDQCLSTVEDALASRGDLRACLEACLRRLAEVPLGPEARRPLVGVTGDLYTRINAAGNGSLFDRLESMGCTVWPSPFFAASSDFEIPRNARRWLGRGATKRAAREAAIATLLRSRSTRLAAVLDQGMRERCVEPSQPTLQGYAVRYVGADSNHLVRGIVAKMVDFAHRGADGVISAIGLGCMVGTAAASAIPSIRREHGGLPIVSIAYGGTEGPSQQIVLETFVHQARQRFESRQTAR